MKRQSKGTVFDISIRGDELENNRIQLEHNLQNTELSFRLSSTSDDEHEHEFKSQTRSRKYQPRNNHNNNSSVEYPRHISEPSLADDYPPFWANRSRERMDDEDQHQMRAWSYRSGDDEDGISPYGGETVSTAAHHASAITINTGLGGGRAARRDPSLSGAEYDPDRPLHAMIAGVNTKHSMFDMDPSKHHATTANMTHDPLVVDSTAELDRILASGHAPPLPPANSRSFQPTPPTSSVSSDSEGGHTHTGSARPKLADHLRHVSFSPKRPRTAQNVHASPLVRAARTLDEDNNNDNNNASMNMPTPRPARRANYAASPAQPEVRLQPATPSTGGSKFTRMARGINRELEATQAQEQLNAKHTHAQAQTATQAQPGGARPASAPPERNPFYDFGTRSQRRTPARDPTMTSGRIHLPDVTGLTSAVESPAKHGAHYYPYKGDDRPRDSEARLLQTLSSVQGQLRDLEEENSISRRRVRELEMELEECKRHVARERTRLFEREELELDARLGYRGAGAGSTSKGKGKAMEGHLELDDERLHARYKEAVDEKKALEALINSLRSHLTRLTAELASHQELLNELRRLRDADARALQDKGAEIGKLKEEVQRLAGEVEVLRGVVEEGLKERRASREVEEIGLGESLGARADMAMSRDLEEEEEEMELEEIEEVTEEEDLSEQEEEEEEDEGNETGEPEPFDPLSLQHSSPVNRADRTMRTDHATLGSSNPGASVNTNGNNDRHGSPRFVDEEELDIIAQEMEERRSNRSNGSIGSLQRRTVRSVSPPGSRDQNGRYERQRAMAEDELEDEQRRQQEQQQQQQQRPPTSRPAAPTPTHAKKQYARPHPPQERNASVNNNYNGEAVVEPETPFPQIRGEHLERLFFSAPEHNAKTCTVCYRRGHRANSVGGTEASPSWSHPRRAGQAQAHAREREEEDEGYEGSEGAEGERPYAAVGGASKGKQREYVAFSEDIRHWQKAGQAHGVPPQTVVARVIRELEDDFTHYKSIYVELADQYKVMDAASDVKRRNLLAKHLREVVDILEQKGDQIASLYDLLEFKDKPVLESVVPGNPTTSWGKSARRTTTTN